MGLESHFSRKSVRYSASKQTVCIAKVACIAAMIFFHLIVTILGGNAHALRIFRRLSRWTLQCFLTINEVDKEGNIPLDTLFNDVPESKNLIYPPSVIDATFAVGKREPVGLLARLFGPFTGITAVKGSNLVQALVFSGFFFETAKFASITAMIFFHIILHPAVLTYCFHIFITSLLQL